jgi:Fe-S cluster assembly protein SufD
MQALPTKRDEAWRYSDFAALEAARAMPARLEARGISVAAGQTQTIIERLDGSGWLTRNAAVQLGENASLTLLVLQTAAADAVITASYAATLATGATLHVFVLNMGARLGRVELTASLNGEGAHAALNAIQLGKTSQTVELVSRFDHVSAHATSAQTVKCVLTNKAVGSYLGKIKVHPGAQKTDAAQSSKAMLLQRTATANTKPELEIYADDVKCAHGATVGELDKAALFYLESRGLPPAKAKALLTRAFVADVVESIADQSVHDEVSALTDAWLQEALA